MNSERRAYVMTARAEATQETADRVIDAFTQLFLERPFAQLTLRQVADRAGVSVQTIIRRFADKDGLTAAAAAREASRIAAQRAAVVPGDLDSIVDNLLDHYDRDGRLALRLLAEEHATASIAPLTADGRALHHAWCAEAFAPFLAPLPAPDRARRLAQLVAVCDVYTWKLLHLDCGLDRSQLRLALRELLVPLTTGPTAPRP